VFRWQKRGRLFDPAAIGSRPDWMHAFAQAPATLMFDRFVRVYFSCRPQPNSNGQYVSRAAYVDLNQKAGSGAGRPGGL
jgi:hypothetical protein